MAKALKSDLASGFFSSGSFDLRREWFEWKMIAVSSEVFKKWLRHLKLKYAFLFKTNFLQEYDTVIFSWDSISAVRNCKKNTKKVYYCHTPPRYLYDLNDLYLQKIPMYLRPFFRCMFYVFRKSYERDIQKMDLVLTNSKNTQARIKKFLWIHSQVLYPPVDLEQFKYLSTQDYYLSFARLSSAKRVDVVVKAFMQMPQKKLLVIYWKNDPQKQEIFDLASWSENIEFITLENNVWFTKYIGNAIATIYIPIDEDFGMSPVESMASWKPVLWVNEGWLKETLIHEQTAYLAPAHPSIEDIIVWVRYLSVEKCLEMKPACEDRARDFSLDEFKKQLEKHV